MSGSISDEKLARRRKQLRKRKHSFVELIMQTKKNLFKEKLEQQQENDEPSSESSNGEADDSKASVSCE